jgi:hypothetical protein
MDRVLPVSLFEKDAKGGKSAVTINITGLTADVSNDEDTTIDAEDVEFKD